MATPAREVSLFTVENVPVAGYLGAVRAWWRDPDFETAEARAFEALLQQASAMGANAVIGVRVETTQELHLDSPVKLGGPAPQSTAVQRVYVTGTAAVIVET